MDGNHAYVTGLYDNAVSWYDRNASTGALTYGGMLRDGWFGVDGLRSAHSVILSSDGNYAYVTAGSNDHSVSWFTRDSGTGALSYGYASDANYTLTAADLGKTITVMASYTDGGAFDHDVSSVGIAPIQNSAPTNLNVTAPLLIAENQPIGTVVGEFNATDPDGDSLTYQLVSGAGSDDNHLFTMDADGTLRLAQVLDYESNVSSAFRTLPGIALNINPGFEDGLTGWGIFGDGNASAVTDPSFVQQGQKAINFHRYGPYYARLVGASYAQLYAGRTYSFSMDFLNYGNSMYSGDQFELHRPGGISHGDPVITDIGNNWKRLTRTLSTSSDVQYLIHFAKIKTGDQFIDNAVVLDITDDDGDGIPHYLEDISAAGYGDDPFFFVRVRTTDEHNSSTEKSFVVTLTDSIEPGQNQHTVDLNSSVDLEMIWVEPGTFSMGSPTTEADRQADETQHNVTLTKGFYLGKYEVTQAQYEAVMSGNGDGLSPTPSMYSGNPNRPVERIAWNDVQVFLSRLNAAEMAAGRLPNGWEYALPSEAQWEYACRAGTTTAYYWGDDINSSHANYNWDAEHNTGIDYKRTRDVGRYPANPWGFYDMLGNVEEWTNDRYVSSYPNGNVSDPEGPGSGTTDRVKRGGAWNTSAPDVVGQKKLQQPNRSGKLFSRFPSGAKEYQSHTLRS